MCAMWPLTNYLKRFKKSLSKRFSQFLKYYAHIGTDMDFLFFIYSSECLHGQIAFFSLPFVLLCVCMSLLSFVKHKSGNEINIIGQFMLHSKPEKSEKEREKWK